MFAYAKMLIACGVPQCSQSACNETLDHRPVVVGILGEEQRPLGDLCDRKQRIVGFCVLCASAGRSSGRNGIALVFGSLRHDAIIARFFDRQLCVTIAPHLALLYNASTHETPMDISGYKTAKLPDAPGVYLFRASGGEILYIGKATSLASRVRSYFSDDLLHTRGKHMVDMVTIAATIDHQQTDSVLEALILEASLIKKHQPKFNTREKDDKSFNYVVITKEDFPRVLLVRERTMLSEALGKRAEYRYAFGPFPGGKELRIALDLVRRIFPFRSSCTPNSGKPCFDRQIGLCPGVCSGEMGKRAYARRVQDIRLFFEGKKGKLVGELRRRMREHAAKLEFEEAARIKRMIAALAHINDVALIGDDIRERSAAGATRGERAVRIEAYDIAHISGTYPVGVMVAVEGGEKIPGAYRKFIIRSERGNDDVGNLEETLTRRLAHPEWRYPDLIAVDGGLPQKRRAEAVLRRHELKIPVVAVVKDERHRPKAFIGSASLSELYRSALLLANAEAHRFAVSFHRARRDRLPKVR